MLMEKQLTKSPIADGYVESKKLSFYQINNWRFMMMMEEEMEKNSFSVWTRKRFDIRMRRES